VSSSSSEALLRLGSALAASGALHVAAALGIDALPWAASGAGPGLPAQAAPVMQVDLRVARAAAAMAAPKLSSLPAPEGAGRYYVARELYVRPAPRDPVEPAYPNDAYLRDISGRVLVRLYIAETGTVEKAVIVDAQPPGYFEEAVQQAFRAARFTPAMKHGRAVKAQVVLEVRYDSPRQLTQ
jgi:TonB family protein